MHTIGPRCHWQFTSSELGSNYSTIAIDCWEQSATLPSTEREREREKERANVLLSKWKRSRVLGPFGLDCLLLASSFSPGGFAHFQISWHFHSTGGQLVLGLHRDNQVKTLTTGGRVDEQTSCLSVTEGATCLQSGVMSDSYYLSTHYWSAHATRWLVAAHCETSTNCKSD